MLKIEHLSAGYGDMQVLFDVSMHVDEGEIVSLVGANGAGKTTLLSVLSGFVPLQKGSVTYMGENLMSKTTYCRAGLGISHIPQGRGIFGTLTVKDNLILGTYSRNSRRFLDERLAHAYALFPKLKARQNQLAGTLSGGEQQMLALGRAMMNSPRLLMLDEPSLGLAPIVVYEMFQMVSRVAKEGVSILIVEQNLVQTLAIADRAYVLETGHLVTEGKASELLKNEEIKKMYLGL